MNKRAIDILRGQVLPAVICMGLAFAMAQTPLGIRMKRAALDQLTLLRAHVQDAPDDRLAVVAIDDKSLETFGNWPWNRAVHGQFMYSISHAKPAAVAWDILFTEPSANDAADAALVAGAEALAGRAIFGAYASDADPLQPPATRDLTHALTRIEGDVTRIPSSPHALLPIPPLRAVALTAFCDTPGDRRAVPLLQRIAGHVFPSLSLQSVITGWQLTPAQVRVVLGDAIYLEGAQPRRIPIDDQGRYFVNYRFGASKARTLPYAQLVIGHTEHYLQNIRHDDLPAVAGKILLVGQFSTGLTDNGPTPFGEETPLVLVHANIINNILSEDYARPVKEWPVFLGAFVLGLVGMVYLDTKRLHQQAIFAFGIPAIYLCSATLLWVHSSLAFPLIWPLVGFGALQVVMMVRQLVREQKSKARIKGMFGAYVSPEVVNRMIESGESPHLGGHEEHITAYFSDIQGFSTFSEKMPPDRLVELMNEYLTACTDIIQEEGGTLDKYIGDAVVAMFGAPVPQSDHAYRACLASQRIQRKITELRERWRKEGNRWPSIVHEMRSRIGMNTGSVIVGNIGSRTRFNYTMMGDNVNLAARMESGAKSWGVYTMCTDATREACVRDGGDRIVFRALGRVVVRGRSSAVPVYEVVGLKEHVADQTRECLRLFEAGLTRHYARDWEGALSLFAQSALLEPNQPGSTPGVSTNPSLVYTEITRRYQIAPPPETWEGEYVMTVK